MTKPKRVVISWSSGKDSTLTLERLNENPDYQVVGLYTTYVGKEVPFQVTTFINRPSLMHYKVVG